MANTNIPSGLASVSTLSTLIQSSFSSLTQMNTLINSQFQSVAPLRTLINSKFTSFTNHFTLINAKSRVFFQDGVTVFARDSSNVLTRLGFIKSGDPLVLTDVALADGDYELEVRPTGTYWNEARAKKLLSVTITAGVIEFQGVPFIQNLTSLILRNYDTRLIWDVSQEFNLAGITFGVWVSASSPVVVTGPPDFEVNAITGIGRYSIDITQTAPRFAAVAAFSATDQATESEISLPWDTVAPLSPKDQFSKT